MLRHLESYGESKAFFGAKSSSVKLIEHLLTLTTVNDTRDSGVWLGQFRINKIRVTMY